MQHLSIFKSLQCAHCGALIGWPRWARVEPGCHTPLCWRCFDRLDERFTAENAIAHALVIVALHQLAIESQVQL